MQLATWEIDITIEQPSFGQKVGQCASREVWRHNGLSAPKQRNEIVVNVNQQLFSSYGVREMFIILKFNIASAICHFRYDIPVRHKAFVTSQFKGGASLRSTKM